MNTNDMMAEIRDANLNYLMLAQQMIRADKACAIYRLGISAEIASLLETLSNAQLLKLASANLMLARFRFDDTAILGMLTSHSKAVLISSKDGASWQPVKVADAATFSWLVWSGTEFIVGDSKSAFRSADGNVWKKSDIKARGDVKWSDGTRFISSSWPGKMAFSADGQNWQDAPLLTANGINRVIFRSSGDTTTVAGAAASEFTKDVRPLLENHCFDCHDSDAKEGDLDLARFTNEEAVMKDRAIWRSVYE